jgi:hypothetical protein
MAGLPEPSQDKHMNDLAPATVTMDSPSRFINR